MIPDMTELKKGTIIFEMQIGYNIYPWFVSANLKEERNIFNIEIQLMSFKNANIACFSLKALTFQPLPHPSLFCSYREQLYDILTDLINRRLNRNDLIVTHITALEGAPVYDSII